MKQKKLILLLLSTLIAASLFGQSSTLRKALGHIESQDYPTALSLIEDGLYDYPQSAELRFYAAYCYIKLRSYNRGSELLAELENSPDRSKLPDFNYWWAFSNYMNGQYDKALMSLNDPNLPEGKITQPDAAYSKLRRQIQTAKNIVSQDYMYHVENMGPSVNSALPEYSPILNSEQTKIYFTRRQHKTTDDAALDPWHYNAIENIYVSEMTENGEWSVPSQEEVAVFNSTKNESPVQLYSNDSKFIICRDTDIFVAEKVDGSWARPLPLSRNFNTYNREVHAFIEPNGRFMVFVSDAFSVNGDLDLMISYRMSDDEWSTPAPITELNTNYDEESPFIDQDGVMYFASKGHDSMGGYDIFRSTYDPETRKWSRPVNMGAPINSVADDIFFTKSGDIGYFSSNRQGGYGLEDIYRVFFYEEIMMAGRVVSPDKIGLANTELRVTMNNRQWKTKTNADGQFSIKLPNELKASFKATVYMDGEELQQAKFLLKDLVKEPGKAYYEIEAAPVLVAEKAPNKPVIQGRLLSIPDRQKTTGKMVLMDLAKQQVLDTIATKKDGTYTVELPNVGGEYRLFAITDGYFTNHYDFMHQSDDKKLWREFRMIPNKDGIAVAIQNIYFDFGKAVLTERSYPYLERLATFMELNPDLRIEVAGHTDNVGTKEFNNELSRQRARVVVNFLRSRNIDYDRMIAVGYGDAKPLASNDDEEDGRELNRRIEIKVLGSDVFASGYN